MFPVKFATHINIFNIYMNYAYYSYFVLLKVDNYVYMYQIL